MAKHAAVLAVALFLTGCQSRKIDNSMMVEPDTEVSYADDIQPIFSASCGGPGCHISSATNGVRLNSYESVISSRGFQYGRLIVSPENASDSPVVDKISPNPDFGVRMPFGRAPLNAGQIGLITKWIEDGAKNN